MLPISESLASATGRFLTRDPIGYAGGLNLYAYTVGNPVNRADPSGLDACAGVLVPAGADAQTLTNVFAALRSAR